MKRTIRSLKQSELVSLINGLQKLNGENRDYIQAFLSKEECAPSLELYKKKIRKALEDAMDEDWRFEIEADNCEKTLKAYLSATDDKLGYAELLVLAIKADSFGEADAHLEQVRTAIDNMRKKNNGGQ